MQESTQTKNYRMLRIMIWGLSGYILLASLGRLYWAGDVLKIFLDYIMLGLLIAVGVAVWRRLWSFAVIGLVACLWGAINLFGFSSAPTYAMTPPDLRLMVFNVYFENEAVEAVEAEITKHDPDLIYLMEYPSEANAVMRLDLDEHYPYQLVEPSRWTMGTAVYSKFPIVDSQLHRGQRSRIPVSEVTIELNGERLTLVGGHPWPPLPQWGALHREQLMSVIDVASAVDRSNTSLVVAGDFNTPPSAYMLSLLSKQAEVSHVRGRFDISKTFFPFPLIGMSLDHVLVSDSVQVVNYFYGDEAGSDHRPLLVDISVSP